MGSTAARHKRRLDVDEIEGEMALQRESSGEDDAKSSNGSLALKCGAKF